jgi:hypothetical protein
MGSPLGEEVILFYYYGCWLFKVFEFQDLNGFGSSKGIEESASNW